MLKSLIVHKTLVKLLLLTAAASFDASTSRFSSPADRTYRLREGNPIVRAGGLPAIFLDVWLPQVALWKLPLNSKERRLIEAYQLAVGANHVRLAFSNLGKQQHVQSQIPGFCAVQAAAHWKPFPGEPDPCPRPTAPPLQRQGSK